LLTDQGARVTYHDPLVPTFSEDGQQHHSTPLTAETVEAADCVLIVTDHSAIDFDMVRQRAKAVVDTRNALGRG
ncbi:MAG: UDP-N-acetyl-D-glucosamine dehydrogenase, partial [Gemmatimonadales bacterium]|nr:UDP-N-acetyl-D-glucosamine dehydrogenase [Gemmatimonadales bacterium]